MNTEESIKVVQEMKRNIVRFLSENAIPETEENIIAYNRKLNSVIDLLEYLEKFRMMWNDVLHLFSGYNDSNLKHIYEKYFPKPKTKKDLINNIIEEVYRLNIHPRADRVDVVNMLIKLRDEEEYV